MIEQVELHNFKSHRSTKINFDDSRLHALVGQNSSGKTSVLQALSYFSRLINSSITDVFRGQNSEEFITTIGQDNVSVVASGSWGNSYPTQWIAAYEIPLDPPFSFSPTVSWNIDQKEMIASVIVE